MTTFFDTSAVIPLTDDTHEFHAWSKDEYERALAQSPPIVISDMVYCEVSMGYSTKQETDAVLDTLVLQRVSYSDEVYFRAGRAFLEYVENHGRAGTVLPDFLIGALAELEGAPIVTNDAKKFRTYFPGVGRITPPK